MKYITAVIILFLSFSVKAEKCSALAYTSVAADLISTKIALSKPNIEEKNPILSDGSNKYLIASGLVRVAAIYYLSTTDKSYYNCVISYFTFGVSANNLTLILNPDADTSTLVGAFGLGIIIPFWLTN